MVRYGIVNTNIVLDDNQIIVEELNGHYCMYYFRRKAIARGGKVRVDIYSGVVQSGTPYVNLRDVILRDALDKSVLRPVGPKCRAKRKRVLRLGR